MKIFKKLFGLLIIAVCFTITGIGIFWLVDYYNSIPKNSSSFNSKSDYYDYLEKECGYQWYSINGERRLVNPAWISYRYDENNNKIEVIKSDIKNYSNAYNPGRINGETGEPIFPKAQEVRENNFLDVNDGKPYEDLIILDTRRYAPFCKYKNVDWTLESFKSASVQTASDCIFFHNEEFTKNEYKMNDNFKMTEYLYGTSSYLCLFTYKNTTFALGSPSDALYSVIPNNCIDVLIGTTTPYLHKQSSLRAYYISFGGMFTATKVQEEYDTCVQAYDSQYFLLSTDGNNWSATPDWENEDKDWLRFKDLEQKCYLN